MSRTSKPPRALLLSSLAALPWVHWELAPARLSVTEAIETPRALDGPLKNKPLASFDAVQSTCNSLKAAMDSFKTEFPPFPLPQGPRGERR